MSEMRTNLSQSHLMGNVGNGDNGLKRITITAINGKRMPLKASLRQNKEHVLDVKNNPIIKQTGSRVTRLGFKANKVQVINDENAKTVVELNSKPIGVKSKIPINKKIRSKSMSRVSTIQESEPVNEIAFSTNLIPFNVEDIDANDTNNVFLTPDYVNEIYNYLRHLEKTQSVRLNFLSIQREMTARMRSVLIDWLINVHHQFRLLPETLYLAISIMDRFFQKEVISKDKIQLVGVTAFFIASKFEEIYPPDIKDFVMICDKLYHKKDILKMELAVLKVLKFELGRPLPLHFLRRNSKAAHADSRIHALAKYLMELTLVEYECAHWNPSLLAATSLYVTLKIFGDSSTKWSPTLEFYSNYTEQELLSSASQLCKIIIKSESSKFQNCRKKYASQKLMEISKIPELKSPVIDQMAAAFQP